MAVPSIPFPCLPFPSLYALAVVLLCMNYPSLALAAHLADIGNRESETPKSGIGIGNRISDVGYRESETGCRVIGNPKIGYRKSETGNKLPLAVEPGMKTFDGDANRECARLRLELAALRQEAEKSRAALELQVRATSSAVR